MRILSVWVTNRWSERGSFEGILWNDGRAPTFVELLRRDDGKLLHVALSTQRANHAPEAGTSPDSGRPIFSARGALVPMGVWNDGQDDGDSAAAHGSQDKPENKVNRPAPLDKLEPSTGKCVKKANDQSPELSPLHFSQLTSSLESHSGGGTDFGIATATMSSPKTNDTDDNEFSIDGEEEESFLRQRALLDTNISSDISSVESSREDNKNAAAEVVGSADRKVDHCNSKSQQVSASDQDACEAASTQALAPITSRDCDGDTTDDDSEDEIKLPASAETLVLGAIEASLTEDRLEQLAGASASDSADQVDNVPQDVDTGATTIERSIESSDIFPTNETVAAVERDLEAVADSGDAAAAAAAWDARGIASDDFDDSDIQSDDGGDGHPPAQETDDINANTTTSIGLLSAGMAAVRQGHNEGGHTVDNSTESATKASLTGDQDDRPEGGRVRRAAGTGEIRPVQRTQRKKKSVRG